MQTIPALDNFAIGKVPENPLEKIAISLSGGGYRAASFHLGGLAYLQYLHYQGKPLLENVEMISTVSGGTITGVVYALMKQNGSSFETCYHFLMDKLETIDLVATGIEKLNPDNHLKNKYKAKNLINAFAEQYDEHFTLGATLADFSTMKSNLKTVVFNATEFTNAINFRFRNPDRYLRTGNDAFRVATAVAKEIKLSDIIASSSCFPGGFEPLLWPDDYIHDDSPLLKALKDKNDQKNIHVTGIMDGGIYDNQGVESILMYKNGMERPYFDLIIVSDVASPDMNAYRPLEERPKKNNWKSLTLNQMADRTRNFLRKVDNILLTTFFLSALIPSFWCYGNNIFTGFSVTLSILTGLLFLTKKALFKKSLQQYEKMKSNAFALIDPFYFKKLSKLKIGELSYHRLEPLVANRAMSLLTLLSVVFLKVVRRLNYKRLYEHPNYSFRRSTSLIGELTEKTWISRHKDGDYAFEIGDKIKKIVETAAGFGTTLWFTDEEKLEKMLEMLVITGQVTMCYNIKAYLEELTAPKKQGREPNGFQDLPPATQHALLTTLATCQQHWNEFRANPDFLSTQLKSNKT
ncbi:patatin-like phospholipase family protein [Pedobacter sp.]